MEVGRRRCPGCVGKSSRSNGGWVYPYLGLRMEWLKLWDARGTLHSNNVNSRLAGCCASSLMVITLMVQLTYNTCTHSHPAS